MCSGFLFIFPPVIHENLYSNGISHSHILIKSLREKYHQLVARACAHAQACMNEIHKQKIKTRQESGAQRPPRAHALRSTYARANARILEKHTTGVVLVSLLQTFILRPRKLQTRPTQSCGMESNYKNLWNTPQRQITRNNFPKTPRAKPLPCGFARSIYIHLCHARRCARPLPAIAGQPGSVDRVLCAYAL